MDKILGALRTVEAYVATLTASVKMLETKKSNLASSWQVEEEKLLAEQASFKTALMVERRDLTAAVEPLRSEVAALRSQLASLRIEQGEALKLQAQTLKARKGEAEVELNSLRGEASALNQELARMQQNKADVVAWALGHKD